MIRRPPRSTQSRSSAASDVYKRQNGCSRIYWRQLRERLVDVVGHQVLASGGVLTPVVDHTDGGLDNLGGVALGVHLTETSPLSELHLVLDPHDGHTVLGAESLDELDVGRLGAVLSKDAQLSTPLVDVLGALADSTDQAIVAQGTLHHILEGRDLVPVLDRLVLGHLDLSNCFFSIDVHSSTSPHVCFLLAPVLCVDTCLLYTSPSPRDRTRSRMPSSA
eukprot:TRINITY_DN1230_c0_g1_i4.p1 TRINITY_DN1230_c0_g1~~TRINITY_DN1230_c0_g1_i4.p1  ORF type:complete len:220 (-),score=77.33 TRINITY_DN1230_c0_g1_i4:136-795(-)